MRRFLATLAAVVLLGSVAWSRPASPHSAIARGAAQRGPGAALRVRVDRVRARLDEDARAGVGAAEELLHALRGRYSDDEDSLDPDSLLLVAGELSDLRAGALLALEPSGSPARADFLGSVAGAATLSDWRYGVPASITIAQAILESGWGRSAPGHNLFGMKGEGPAGSTARRVVEYQRGRRVRRGAAFRLYNTAAESIADHGRVLGTSRHYARARAAGDDVEAFARALVGVYATDPRYAGKLARIIRDNDLTRFDLPASGPWE